MNVSLALILNLKTGLFLDFHSSVIQLELRKISAFIMMMLASLEFLCVPFVPSMENSQSHRPSEILRLNDKKKRSYSAPSPTQFILGSLLYSFIFNKICIIIQCRMQSSAWFVDFFAKFFLCSCHVSTKIACKNMHDFSSFFLVSTNYR